MPLVCRVICNKIFGCLSVSMISGMTGMGPRADALVEVSNALQI
jgi:hypothetical protein